MHFFLIKCFERDLNRKQKVQVNTELKCRTKKWSNKITYVEGNFSMEEDNVNWQTALCWTILLSKRDLAGYALLLMYFISFWSINHCSIKSLVRFLNCRATEGRGKETFNFH